MLTNQAMSLFLLSRKAKGISYNTIRWYRGILSVFEAYSQKLPTSPVEIDCFLADLKVGDERRHGYYRTIKCLYRFLARRYDLKNPIEYIDPPKRRKKQPAVFTPAELQSLLTSLQPGVIKSAILFMIDAGVRLGEFATMDESKIDETQWGFIAKITGKTDMRIVPISYETYHSFMVHPVNGYKKAWLGVHISKAIKDAGLKGTAHTLRHTFATLWQGDELILQKIMGHSTLETTKIYRQLRTSAMERQHNQFSPLKMLLSSTRSML